jgi:hypothetical protein
MAKHTQLEGKDMLAEKRQPKAGAANKKVRFPARPQGDPDVAALRDKAKAKFPKTIARLAK